MFAARLTRHALLTFAAISLAACGSDDVPISPSNPASESYAASLNVDIATMTRVSDDLYIQDIAVGTGDEAVGGRDADVTYTG